MGPVDGEKPRANLVTVYLEGLVLSFAKGKRIKRKNYRYKLAQTVV
jgi:hypothetical protein